MPRSPIAVVLLALLLTGCGGGSPPPASSPAPTSASAAVDDPPGTITCARLTQAITDATLMQPGVVDSIVAASTTADAPVADAARRLGEAYAAAVAAHGTADEPDAVAAVSAAAAEMSQVCVDSGLETAG
ncbi:hypothetical protein EV385_4164 [Krasilnikovia cinnamomea]|uniref:Lipoprotein n=1 Tax=Krasilnikovia cinnamomea TaxID=349313 RepID=A0A4Q7ZP72_9ACTN|nr:hypothetical protein [Krasilnikovia cinnamomea]RZU52313.1 hypothetical protein EV385_4164 [Krasilnikovia cinnamomea]